MFHDLSPTSRYRRFFSVGEPPDAMLDRFCDSADPARSFTLGAHRHVEGTTHVIAIGSYFAIGPHIAEVAFAVDDRFHGKGLGTTLLERLAHVAVANGFDRFEATTMLENEPMLQVFRDSGFEVRSRTGAGGVVVQLSLGMSDRGVAAAEERHRRATVASMRPLLAPRAVAVVGASRNPSNIGRRVLDALVAGGYTGAIYPVNTHAAEVAGLRAYASIGDVPPGVELAVIAVPRDAVLDVVDACAVAHVSALVVITAGFAEVGEEGRALQERLLEKVRGYGMRMVGPNCMGLLNTNPSLRMNGSFSPIVPAPGHIALSSQSGALGLALIDMAAARGLGLSSFVSIGNKADVSSNDLLEYWEDDAATRVILLYLESFGNPRRFARLARRVGRTKPIVVVKSGRTRAGSLAATSHTAALAASDVAVDALFRQTGVVRADTIDEMFDIAACLDTQALPAGRKVTIVTNAGGPAILAADACEAAGLEVAPLSEAARMTIASGLPSTASCRNPVDMIASAGGDEYRHTIEAALAAPETDALLVMYTPVETGAHESVLRGIREGVANGRRAGAANKPVLACVLASGGCGPIVAGGETVPVFAFPENAVRALGKVASYAQWRAEPAGLMWDFDDIRSDEGRGVCRAALARSRETWLTPDEIRRVLTAFGLPIIPGTLAASADEAVAAADALGFPVAAKLIAPGVQHKTDVGGVRLGLSSAFAVRDAFSQLMEAGRSAAPGASIDGVLIQPMVAGGVETMLGITRDPVFGSLLAFGLGGIHVEVLKDVQFRVGPLTDRDADELLHGIRAFRLLEGYRGHAAADIDALRDLLLRLSRLAEEVPEIQEVDLNPVIALAPGEGCRIVDARIRVSASGCSLP